MNFLTKAFLAVVLFAVPASVFAGCRSCKKGKGKFAAAAMMKRQGKGRKAGRFGGCRSGRCSRKNRTARSKQTVQVASTAPAAKQGRTAALAAYFHNKKGGHKQEVAAQKEACENGACARK